MECCSLVLRNPNRPIELHGKIVYERVTPGSTKRLVLLPEMHVNYTTTGTPQKTWTTLIARSIYHGIASLRSLGFDLLCCEGAAGQIDEITTREDLNGLDYSQRLEKLFACGRLAGFEIFSILNPHRIHIFGVEDPTLYTESLQLSKILDQQSPDYEENWQKFLCLADKRSEAMVRNTLKLMETTRENAVIMNFGVSHLEFVVHSLEQELVSFIVVEPNGLAEMIELNKVEQ